MVTSIGSSPGTSNVLSGTSEAGLDAQIARDKKELSACENCESAKTIAGKAKIEALSNKISKAEARLAEIAAARPAKSRVTDSAAPSKEVSSAKGSRIDVFA